MLYCPWVLVAMETHFYVFTLKYQYFEKFLREHCMKSNMLQFSYIMICKNVARELQARFEIRRANYKKYAHTLSH